MRDLRWLRDPRVGWCVFGAVAIAYAVAHVAALFSEGVNWDEYGLLWRAEKAVQTGVIDGGGRPGLAVIVLYPFVDGCHSTESVIDAARVVWAALTFGILGGVFALVASAARGSPERWRAAALATASIALVPVFMRWSLQVRTDQPAVLASLWAGVALLATRRRDLWATVAGVLVGVGYLFSQKAIYVAGLVVVVAVGMMWCRRELVWRELRRAALAVGGAVAAIVIYTIVVRVAFVDARASVSVSAAFDLFAWYREVVGFRVYVNMFVTLLPLVILAGMVLLALARALRVRDTHLRPMIVVVAVLLAGIVVAVFHAAAFPYFWITLGLFPAIAIGLAWPAARAYFPRASLVAAAGAIALFAWRAIPYRIETLRGSRDVQRESLDFVDNLPPTFRGFHPDGALVCRRDPSPFRVYLREHIVRLFEGPDAAANTWSLLVEMRSRPVAFIVRTFRLDKFPPELRTFWEQHYVAYRGKVELAGQRVHADNVGTRTLDIIVPGRYRWISTREVFVNGVTVRPGGTIELAAAPASLVWLAALDGVLVLAVDAPMAPSTLPYHYPYPLLEVIGARPRW